MLIYRNFVYVSKNFLYLKVFMLVYQGNFKFRHFDRNCCVNKNSYIYDFSVFVQFKLVLWEMSFKSVLIFSLMFLPLPQAWEGCLADWVVKLIFSSFKYSNICLIWIYSLDYYGVCLLTAICMYKYVDRNGMLYKVGCSQMFRYVQDDTGQYT